MHAVPCFGQVHPDDVGNGGLVLDDHDESAFGTVGAHSAALARMFAGGIRGEARNTVRLYFQPISIRYTSCSDSVRVGVPAASGAPMGGPPNTGASSHAHALRGTADSAAVASNRHPCPAHQESLRHRAPSSVTTFEQLCHEQSRAVRASTLAKEG